MQSRFAILLIGLVAAVQAAPPPFDPDGEAASLRNAYAPHVKNRAAVQKNWVQPFTSTDQLATPNGTKFNVSLSCEGERKAASVLLVPGATGDIDTLTIRQDLGSDGTLDTNNALPFAVSGICANGVVSCQPGTWSACKYYQWVTAASSSELAVNEVSAKDLGGCYCINNHCGNNLVLGNINNIFGDLLGGAMSAVNAKTTAYLPSRVEIDGITASYWVRTLTSGTDCTTPQQSNTIYASNALNLGTDAAAAKDTNSFYKLVKDSDAAKESVSGISSCEITRNVSITHDDIQVLSCQVGTWFAVNSAGVFDPVGDDAWVEVQALCDPTGPLQVRLRAWDGSGKDHCNAAMGADAAGFVTVTMPANNQIDNGYVMTHPNLYQNSCYDVPVLYSGSCTAADGPCAFTFRFFNGNLDPIFDGNGAAVDSKSFSTDSCANRPLNGVECVDVPGGSVAHAGELPIELTFTRPHITPVPDLSTCRVDQEWFTDQCQTLAADSKCQLMNESVDGVKMVADFQPTGRVPLGGTFSKTDPACTVNVSRDWWDKKRDYRCYQAQKYNFDAAISRAALVRSTTDSTTLQYDDKRLRADGTWDVDSTPHSLGAGLAIKPIPVCTHACKTRVERVNTDADTLGVDADLRTSNLSYDYHYKECTAANVCPLEGTEQLDTDCMCLNEFGEAAAMVQVMRLGAQDTICTSGTPQKL